MSIQRWAMMSPQNTIVRVDSFKQSPTSLPVHYPGKPDVSPWNQQVRQLPFNEWDVEAEQAVVTYTTVEVTRESLVSSALSQLQYLFDDRYQILLDEADGDSEDVDATELEAARDTIESEINELNSNYSVYHYNVDTRFEELVPYPEVEED